MQTQTYHIDSHTRGLMTRQRAAIEWLDRHGVKAVALPGTAYVSAETVYTRRNPIEGAPAIVFTRWERVETSINALRAYMEY